jgi:hypothetical protein
VQQHADDASHRAGDVELARAEQWHLVEPEAPGRDGRELGVQVVGRREQAADHLLGPEVVARHQLS